MKLNQVQDLLEFAALMEGLPTNKIRYLTRTRKDHHAIKYFAHMYVSCRLVYRGRQLESVSESGTEQTWGDMKWNGTGIVEAALKREDKTVKVHAIVLAYYGC